MNIRLFVLLLIVCSSDPLLARLSSRADATFLENSDQFQEDQGVKLEAFLDYQLELESGVPANAVQGASDNESYYQGGRGVVKNKYLPPVVKKEADPGNVPQKESSNRSFGMSFSQMAKKTQKNNEKRTVGFSFSQLAKEIQKTPTLNAKEK